MTAYNTTEYANALTGAPYYTTQTMNNQKDVRGNVRVKRCTFPASTAWAQDDTVNLGKVPKGAYIIGAKIINDAFGTSVTLGLTGNDGSARTFVTAYSIASAGFTQKVSEYVTALAADTVIVATLAAANPTDNAGCTIFLEYVEGC